MCGIVGLFGGDNNFNPDVKLNYIKDGLYLDALRGKESTGVAVLLKDKNRIPLVYKRALKGADFVDLRHTDLVLGSLRDSYGVIGHNRSATRGNVIDDHSHPFQYKHITLVHNGTVNNAENLLDYKDRLNDGIKVDSAHVAWAFAHQEADKLLPIMTGGFSLVWWDARDQSLHFARNTERPMWWAIATDKQTLYYASEKNFLYTLTNRLNIKIQDEFLYTAPFTHYTLRDPKNVTKYETSSFQKPSVKSGKQKGSKGAGPTGWEKDKRDEATVTLLHQPKTTNSSGKTTESSKDSSTATTQETTKSKVLEGPKPQHPCMNEKVSPMMADTLTSTRDTKKAARTIELCEEHNLQFGKATICIPVSWKPYQDETKMGYMVCKHPTSGLMIQIFGISMGRWTQLSAFTRIPVMIFSHRGAYDEENLEKDTKTKPDIVFVAHVREDLLEKIKLPRHSDKDTTTTEKTDDGHKTDYVEVGTRNPRWVSPAVFKQLVDCGCYNCSAGIPLEDHESIMWIGNNDEYPVCKTCATNPQLSTELERLCNDQTH
jgi:predicted glutamine amidotransferase